MTFVADLRVSCLFVFISIFHFDFSFRFFISISAYDWSVVVPWMIRLNTGM